MDSSYSIDSAKPIDGFLDDYAFIIRGLLDLYTACQDEKWIEWADELQQKQDQLFWDSSEGGYFTSASGDSSILIRLKEGVHETFICLCEDAQVLYIGLCVASSFQIKTERSLPAIR